MLILPIQDLHATKRGLVPAAELLAQSEPSELVVVRIGEGATGDPAGIRVVLRSVSQVVVAYLSGDCAGSPWLLAQQFDLCLAETGTLVGRHHHSSRPVRLGTDVQALGDAEYLRDVLADWAASVSRSRATRHLAATLRQETYRDIIMGLTVESLLYSTLQAGEEHQTWLNDRR